MRTVKYLLIIILSIVLFTGCKKDDALLFKEEYESLNSSEDYRTVNISKDNPMVYIKDTELATKIKNKEDMVVYFGFNRCPWCRSIIENLLQVSSDLKIDKIYYLDILSIRDTKKVDENGEIVTEKEGSEGYQEIVSLLGDNLADYIVDGNLLGKRIYAPNILIIKNGEIKPVITGLSSLQTEPKMELTDEIKKDSYDKIYKLLSEYANTTCSDLNGC